MLPRHLQGSRKCSKSSGPCRSTTLVSPETTSRMPSLGSASLMLLAPRGAVCPTVLGDSRGADHQSMLMGQALS